MKFIRKHIPIIFKKKPEELIDLLNDKFPINLKSNVDLIDRIHNRYPFISKAEVAIVVKAIFQSLREFLVLGKIISLPRSLNNMRLVVWDHIKYNPSIKVKLKTTRNLKKP